MKRVGILVFAVLVCCCADIGAYEYETHNGVTAAARRYVVSHADDCGSDTDYVRLIKDADTQGPGFGSFIDTRAGDEHPVDDHDHKISWTDEDRTDGATATSDRGRG